MKKTRYVKEIVKVVKEEVVGFDDLVPGTCFSWGGKVTWYIKVDEDAALNLNSGLVLNKLNSVIGGLARRGVALVIASEVAYRVTE